MKIKIFISIIVILFVAVSPVYAGNLSPEHEITLNSDVLTLGDVFKGVTSRADHVLAPAPRSSETMVLNTFDLQRISNAFNLHWKPETGFERSIIRRNTSYISKGDIASSIEKKLSKQMHGQTYEIEMANKNSKVALKSNEDAEINVEKLKFNPKTGAFLASITLKTSKEEKTVKLNGRAFQIVEVPVITKRIRNGDIIEDADISFISIRLEEVSANTILDETKLIGKTPRRYLNAMQTIQPNDVSLPLAVKKGEKVTLSFKHGVLNLSTMGKALENGAEGETVRVMNITSNRVIEGRVIGPQQIEIIGIL